MRKIETWYEITYKDNGIFKTQHHLAMDKDRAERWGESKFGKIYGVQKVSRDDLFRDREQKNNQMIANQMPLGMKIAKGVYESDINLTDMLFGKPKKEAREKRVGKKSKWDILAEGEAVN
jgi:hypothetical protein